MPGLTMRATDARHRVEGPAFAIRDHPQAINFAEPKPQFEILKFPQFR
jgi:hypothetical protein